MKCYAGVYEQPNRFKVEVLLTEQKLFIKEFNHEMPLTMIGEHRFSFKFPQADQPLEIYMQPESNAAPKFIHQYVWAFKRVDADKHVAPTK